MSVLKPEPRSLIEMHYSVRKEDCISFPDADRLRTWTVHKKKTMPSKSHRESCGIQSRKCPGLALTGNFSLNFAAFSLRQTWKEWGLDAAGWFSVFDKMSEASDGDGYYPRDSDRLVGYWEIWPLGLSGRFTGVDRCLFLFCLIFFLRSLITVFLNKL